MITSYQYLQLFYKDLKKCRYPKDYKILKEKILDKKFLESYSEEEKNEIIEEVESVVNYLS